MIKIAIIIGSTRPGRLGESVARWALELAAQRDDAQFELVDIRDFNLPLLDEPEAASTGRYTKPHTLAWSAKIASFDAFVFVTPEYNHATTGALKNAIDFLWAEWNNKVAGFVSYGSAGGVRAVENLRLIMAELEVVSARKQVMLSLATDFKDRVFQPDPRHQKTFYGMLDQMIAWAGALKPLRQKKT